MRHEMIDFYLKETGLFDHLNQKNVTEVVVNRPFEIATEGQGGWQFHDAPNASPENLMHLAATLTTFNKAGMLNEENPIKSLVLPNGERAQVVIPPACLEGTLSLTIRKPSTERFTLNDYLQSGRFSTAKYAKKATAELREEQRLLRQLFEAAQTDESQLPVFLQEGVNQRLNFLIVGGTGSGKTTFAKTIADLFPHDRRIITIEDVPEMSLPFHRNCVRLFFKEGGVTPKKLIEAAMRMKPDHIFLAELRGDEAWSYLEALNTGHEGSVTTIHANNTYASFYRLASIIKQSEIGLTLDMELIRRTIKSSIDIILFFNHTYLTEIYFNPEEKNALLAGA
ncbi:MAG TPA: P-type DNA transfer ATPase VirB11 [Arsenophonus nasoniae]|uniref:P-type DNA transfer ATPase VirB11 n=1 Tax=Arsenophonus nasoniae TaxID=638 RepID=UPI0038798393